MIVKKELCFSSFVFGSYQKYIPYYIYSISKTYPDAFVKVFVDAPLEKNIKEALNRIRKEGFIRFEIISDAFDNIIVENNYKIKGGAKKIFRWLINGDYFKDYKYVYFGDIDILILSERCDIVTAHSNQIQKYGLPFSNKVRTDDFGNSASRLTGLHFVEVKPYFEKIGPLVTKFIEDITFRDFIMEDISRDENLLYKLNKIAFNFDDNSIIAAKRPWHGLHLGITRGNKDINIKTIKENSSLSIYEIKNQLILYHEDKLFKEIMRGIFVMEYLVILNHLHIPMPLSWKLKALGYDLGIFKKTFRKNIKKYLNV